MNIYKGYVFRPYTNKDLEIAGGRWFIIVRPNGSLLSNTSFYLPGKVFCTTALTEQGAVRIVKRAIRRDKRGR